MSYHRTSEAAPLGGAATMTVCTNDVALCHLVQDALPLAVPEAGSNPECLISEMIELQHDRVGLAAIDARVLSEVGHEIRHAFNPHDLLSSAG